MSKPTPDEKLLAQKEKLLAQKEAHLEQGKKLKAKLRKLVNKENEKKKKKETREKIILGGILIAKLKNKDDIKLEILSDINKYCTDKDRNFLQNFIDRFELSDLDASDVNIDSDTVF